MMLSALSLFFKLVRCVQFLCVTCLSLFPYKQKEQLRAAKNTLVSDSGNEEYNEDCTMETKHKKNGGSPL